MNLKDFAKKLELSQTTVSRALGGYPEVNEQTRNRVSEAAVQFGYRPNHAARGLATGRAKVIGVVLKTYGGMPSDPHYMEFLNGIGESAAVLGYDIMLCPATEQNEQATYRRLAESGQVDAVVLSSPLRNDERVKWLNELGLPFYLHGRTQSDHLSADYLDIDNRKAFYDATKLLLQLGHRDIAILNGHKGMNFAEDRHQGAMQALAEAGIEQNSDLIFRGDMTEEFGHHITSQLLARTAKPTAIICSSLFLALGAVRMIYNHDLTLGREISLIAHDDVIPYLKPENFRTPITTTRSSIREAGKHIMMRLAARLEGKSQSPMQELWPVDLIVRDSIGPVQH